jgi:hypothetical protein
VPIKLMLTVGGGTRWAAHHVGEGGHVVMDENLEVAGGGGTGAEAEGEAAEAEEEV